MKQNHSQEHTEKQTSVVSHWHLSLYDTTGGPWPEHYNYYSYYHCLLFGTISEHLWVYRLVFGSEEGVYFLSIKSELYNFAVKKVWPWTAEMVSVYSACRTWIGFPEQNARHVNTLVAHICKPKVETDINDPWAWWSACSGEQGSFRLSRRLCLKKQSRGATLSPWPPNPAVSWIQED